MNYGAPKQEMYAIFYFIEKFHSYLAGRQFTLRVDNQALSWLKTYSMDQAMIGRWIARLDQYNFNIVHRPRTQHRNADGLSKRTNDYIRREEILEKLPRTREGFGFLSQKEFDELPTLPYIDKNGHVIPNHPGVPPKSRRHNRCYSFAPSERRQKSRLRQATAFHGIPLSNGKIRHLR